MGPVPSAIETAIAAARAGSARVPAPLLTIGPAMTPSRDISRLSGDHGGAAHAGLGLSVGPRAELRDHCAVHARGSLRGGRRDRAPRSRATCATNSAICCSRSSFMPAWRRSKTRSTSATWSQAITEKLMRRHPHVFGEAGKLTSAGRRGPVGAHQGAGKSRAGGHRAARRPERGALAGVPVDAPCPDARPQAAGQGLEGRLRLERSARGAQEDPRGSR